MDQDDHLLPADASLLPTTPKEVKVGQAIEEVIQADLEAMQSCMQLVYTKMNEPKLSVDSVCKLVLTTFKALEYRRKLLLLPYAPPTSKGDQGDVVLPLDRD